MILAGDIGGTHTRLAYFQEANGSLAIQDLKIYASQQHGSLSEIVRIFLTEFELKVSAACFGVAGPVVHESVKTTNLPWVVDAKDLAIAIEIKEAYLINDLLANTWGIQLLKDDDFVVLNHGAADAEGNGAVISAGTGLGEAGIYWDGKNPHPFACEGGHADFSPRDQLQADLLAYLLKQFEHVSWERVLSGPGLHNIYCFLRDTGRFDEPTWLADQLKVTEAGRAITENAMAAKSVLCEQAVSLFVALYGSEAGNLALKTMALGGVYLGGGIAPKILPKLSEPIFMQEFTEKGRMKSLLTQIPVRVIRNENTALLGAAQYAFIRAKQLCCP